MLGTLALTCQNILVVHAAGKGLNHRSSSRVAHEWRQVRKEGCGLQQRGSGPKANAQTEEASNATAVRLAPLHQDMHEWHFSFSGVLGSPYEGGVYHGRFLLSEGYPRLAPRVQMLTPSGRFKCRTDLCLSASSYHQESWSTHWSLHKLATALRLHMLTRAHEIGGKWRARAKRFIYALPCEKAVL